MAAQCPKCGVGEHCISVTQENPGLWIARCNLCGWYHYFDKRNGEAVGVRKHEMLEHETKWRPCEACGDVFFTMRERFCRICKDRNRRRKRIEAIAEMAAEARIIDMIAAPATHEIRGIEDDIR